MSFPSDFEEECQICYTLEIFKCDYVFDVKQTLETKSFFVDR